MVFTPSAQLSRTLPVPHAVPVADENHPDRASEGAEEEVDRCPCRYVSTLPDKNLGTDSEKEGSRQPEHEDTEQEKDSFSARFISSLIVPMMSIAMSFIDVPSVVPRPQRVA